jgi:hypothetical protein
VGARVLVGVGGGLVGVGGGFVGVIAVAEAPTDTSLLTTVTFLLLFSVYEDICDFSHIYPSGASGSCSSYVQSYISPRIGTVTELDCCTFKVTTPEVELPTRS